MSHSIHPCIRSGLEWPTLRSLVEHFLLEKSRLVAVEPNARNYHILYYLVRGLDEITKAELKLTQCEDFAILSQGGVTTISEDHDDGEGGAPLVNPLVTG
jgi:myosin heavy subunit